MRASFWKSRKRNKALWEVLKDCCESDSDTAEVLLEASNMACLEGNLRKVYFLSNPELILRVPNYCICDPVFERDYDLLKINCKKKEEKNISIILYYFNENKNITIETTNKTLVKKIKKIFAQKVGINLEVHKIRFFCKGLELLDDNLLCYNGVENLSKIHVLANPI